MSNNRGIASIPKNLDAELHRVLVSIKERIEVGAGLGRGNPNDRYLTINDLVDANITRLITVIGKGGTTDNDLPTGGTDYDSTIPPVPTGLTAVGGFTFVALRFDVPAYDNHAFTNIYRHTSDAFANAEIVGTSTVPVASDPVNSGSSYYYWVTHVSTSDVEGPPNATAGTLAETAIPPEHLLEILSNRITAGELFQSLSERIDLIDTTDGGVIANLLAEIDERTSAVGSLQTQIDVLSLASASEVFYQDSEPVDGDAAGGILLEESLWYDTDDGNKPYRYIDDVWVDVSDQRVIDNAATIAQVNAAWLGATEALAIRSTALEASVNDPVAGVEANAAAFNTMSSAVSFQGGVLNAHSSSLDQLQVITGTDYAALQEVKDVVVGDGGLKAQWGIKTDVNDLQGGVGFYNDGVTTQFVAITNDFAIISPGATSLSFTVSEGLVVMDAAHIVNLTVTDAQIQDVAADKMTGFDVTFIQAVLGDAWISNAMIGSAIQSDGYSNVTAGWQLHKTLGLTIRGAGGAILLSSPIVGSAQIGTEFDNGSATLESLGAGALASLDAVDYLAHVTGGPPTDATNGATPAQITAINNAANTATWNGIGAKPAFAPSDATNGANAADLIAIEVAGNTALWNSVWDKPPFAPSNATNGATTQQVADISNAASTADWNGIGSRPSDAALLNSEQQYNAIQGAKPPTNADNTAANTGAVAQLNTIPTTYIANLAVSTIKIGNDAVTVPAAANGGTFSGNGTMRFMFSITVVLDHPGDVTIWWAFAQGYASGQRNWGFKITRNGATIKIRPTMNAIIDYPSGMVPDHGRAAGTYTYSLYWYGQDSTISTSGSMLALGTKK